MTKIHLVILANIGTEELYKINDGNIAQPEIVKFIADLPKLTSVFHVVNSSFRYLER